MAELQPKNEYSPGGASIAGEATLCEESVYVSTAASAVT